MRDAVGRRAPVDRVDRVHRVDRVDREAAAPVRRPVACLGERGVDPWAPADPAALRPVGQELRPAGPAVVPPVRAAAVNARREPVVRRSSREVRFPPAQRTR